MVKWKAQPVVPVKLVEMSSERLVRMVSQVVQENRYVPPMWSRKILPIVVLSAVTNLQERKKKISIKKKWKVMYDTNSHTAAEESSEVGMAHRKQTKQGATYPNLSNRNLFCNCLG